MKRAKASQGSRRRYLAKRQKEGHIVNFLQTSKIETRQNYMEGSNSMRTYLRAIVPYCLLYTLTLVLAVAGRLQATHQPAGSTTVYLPFVTSPLLAMGEWTVRPSTMPTPRAEMPGVLINGLIYVPGGVFGYQTLEIYDPA